MFYDSPQLVPYLYFSACDAAGYDGQWVGGICPYWGTDICTCDKEVIDEFKRDFNRSKYYTSSMVYYRRI